jgi:ribosome-associated toxin RatA of RatAB toxin-antitoxin module
MYALVNDVGAYSQFLPWCTDSAVEARTDTSIVATVTLAKGAVRQSFTTENRLEPDRRIEMQLVKGPFRKLHGVWRFDPVGEIGCQVSLDLEFEFSNHLMSLTFGGIFQQIANTLLDTFCRRAQTLHIRPSR